MNKRETILVVAVGAFVLLAVAKYGADKARSSFVRCNNEIEKLESELQQKEQVVRNGQEASTRIAAYDQRALPKEPELASSLYRAWLLALVHRAGIGDGNVHSLPGRPYGEMATRFTFMVTGRGDLQQLTQFLYDFYRVDHLHRIGMLVIKPVPNTKILDLTFSIEALSLPGSTNRDKLTEKPADRLALSSVDQYVRVIVGRNFVSPPNKPPVLMVSSRSTYYVGDPISLTASAEDPEGDPITYKLGEDAPPDATIDPSSGRVAFRADEPGEFEFTVLAEDGGLPPAWAAPAQVRFQVTERPPQPAREETPPPPAFDSSQFAFLTGITEVDGRSQVWIHLRTDGRLLKLHEGDTFEVGAVKGRITRISRKEVEFEAEGTRMLLALGDNLRQARPSPMGQ